jgi:hypothetical protein
MPVSDRLVNELTATLPGSGEAMLKQMIWNVADEACRQGHIWRETIPVTLTAGDLVYTPAPAGTEIIHVFSVAHELIDVRANEVMFEFGTLTLSTEPTVAEAALPMYLVAALTPAIDAGADVENLIPQDMWSKHHHMLYSGVMARMLAQPAKPYSNASLAAFHLRKFRGELAEARHEVKTGGVPGAQMWRFPKWAPRALR